MCSRAFFYSPKLAIFGPKLQFLKLRSTTWESRSRPPPLSFWLKLCVIVLHTHRYHPPKFQPNLKHHDRILIFTHFARAACLLAAAACLLAAAAAAAAKPSRSTLDTKKGYKTKTGSTSSVTLALTLAPALTPEGGQGEVTGACAPPPTTPNRPTWTPPPPTDPPDRPPPHRPSLNPPPPMPPPPPPPLGAFGPLLLGGGVASKSEGTAPPCLSLYFCSL